MAGGSEGVRKGVDVTPGATCCMLALALVFGVLVASAVFTGSGASGERGAGDTVWLCVCALPGRLVSFFASAARPVRPFAGGWVGVGEGVGSVPDAARMALTSGLWLSDWPLPVGVLRSIDFSCCPGRVDRLGGGGAGLMKLVCPVGETVSEGGGFRGSLTFGSGSFAGMTACFSAA